MDKSVQLSQQLLSILTGNGGVQTPAGEPLGAEYLYSKFPDEIEYYALALELVNSEGHTEEFFSFPVLSDSLHISGHPLNKIIKTMTGTVINNNPTYPLSDIKLQGNFGRRFKRVTNVDDLANSRAQRKIVFSSNSGTDPLLNEGRSDGLANITVGAEFDREWKTGYGCIKILERILKKAALVDSNNSVYKLFFYNLAFNQSVMVEVVDYSFDISKELNRIWQYDISLKAVGAASDFNSNYITRKQLIAVNKLIQDGNATAQKGQDALQTKAGAKGLKTNLKKLLDSEVGRRVYQVGVAYQPDILRTAFQLAENPDSIQYFVPNVGNNILNTGRIF